MKTTGFIHAWGHLFCLIGWLPVLFFSSCAPGKNHNSGNGQVINTGQVTKAVKCAGDTAISYSVFVPSKEPPSKAWPVLICFDPQAEGLLPVNLFRGEAEKNGFILAGSNDSRNGMSPSETTHIFRMMLEDLRERNTLEENSVYLLGFSGGARVAGAIAISEGNIAGVIGCGAGLPGMNNRPENTFSYLLVGGNEDFNLNELQHLDEVLDDAGFNHHLLAFDGPHQWPPAEMVPLIFNWIQFDRMRKGTLAVDRDKINAFIDTYSSEAMAEAAKGNVMREQSVYLFMKHFLKGLTDIKPLQTEIERLDADPLLQKARNEQAALQEQESSLQSSLAVSLQQKNADWWVKERTRLRELAEKQPATDESRMYKRLLGYLSLNCYMLANSAIKQGNLPVASEFVEKYQLVDPKNSEHRYMAATIEMMKGNGDKSINELLEAVSLGFKDFNRLKNDKNFQPLHHDARFLQFIKGK